MQTYEQMIVKIFVSLDELVSTLEHQNDHMFGYVWSRPEIKPLFDQMTDDSNASLY